MSIRAFRAVVALCLSTIYSPVAWAQTASVRQAPIELPPLDRPPVYSGPPLTLSAAIEDALQRNPTLIALRHDLDAARQRPSQAGVLSPPTLSAQIWQWPVNSINPLDTNMYMLSIEQEFPGRGKRDLRVAVLQKDGEIAANAIAVRARDVLADLKRAYATLFVARKAAELYAQSGVILRQLADASEARYASGRNSQQDVLKPAVELSKLYDDALMFRQQAELAAAQLNVLIGRPADAAIGPLQDVTPASPIPSVAALVQLALDHQPELHGAHLAIERAKAELGVARSDAKPDYMVQGGYMLTPRGTDAWTGQVGITWPSAPWSRGRVTAHVAEVRSTISAAEARLQVVESAIRIAVQQASIRIKTAEQRAALLETTIVPQSRQALEVARVGYETDRVDFLTVLENQRTLLNEQLDHVRVLGDLAEARADLERAVGVDLASASIAVGLQDGR